jgi:hypothetical protein
MERARVGAMATDEEAVLLAERPGSALQTCATALTRAGFKDVAANAGALLVTGRKRTFGQWTKSQVTLALLEVEAGTRVTIVAHANAQSLSSLAASPSRELVDSVLDELRKAGPVALADVPTTNAAGQPVEPSGHPLDPDSYSDDDRPPNWYIDPKSPWKMKHWDGGSWGERTQKTPRRTLDSWWKITEPE